MQSRTYKRISIYYKRYITTLDSFLALVATVLIHILLILVLRDHYFNLKQVVINKEYNDNIYKVQLNEVDETVYVEANPKITINEPDRKNQYSYRAQQAADPYPSADPTNQPRVLGELDTQKIVQARSKNITNIEKVLDTQLRSNKENSESRQSYEKSTHLSEQAHYTPEFIKKDLETKEISGSKSSTNDDLKNHSKKIAKFTNIRVYQSKDLSKEQQRSEDNDKKNSDVLLKPRLRPRLAPELISGPLMRSKGSASRHGAVAIDATFSDFGEYEKQFYSVIQSGWHQEIEYFQPIDSARRVQIRFTIHANGEITNLQTVHSSATDIATFICETAILNRSPFRPWTQEMIKVFGNERILNVVFHYH